MTLEKLQIEMIAAMKAKDKMRKETISGLVDAVKKATITKDGRIEVTEDLVTNVILKEQKTIKEMIDTCPATRTDLLEVYNQKRAIIDEFAPKLITDPEEIKQYILNLVEETDLTLTKADRGKIMKVLKGSVDMGAANKILAILIV